MTDEEQFPRIPPHPVRDAAQNAAYEVATALGGSYQDHRPYRAESAWYDHAFLPARAGIVHASLHADQALILTARFEGVLADHRLMAHVLLSAQRQHGQNPTKRRRHIPIAVRTTREEIAKRFPERETEKVWSSRNGNVRSDFRTSHISRRDPEVGHFITVFGGEHISIFRNSTPNRIIGSLTLIFSMSADDWGTDEVSGILTETLSHLINGPSQRSV